MKTLNLAAVSLILLVLGCRLVSAQTEDKPVDAGTAWKQLQLQRAAVLSGLQNTDEKVAAAALAVSENAKAFYTQFPDSSNVLAARILECKMLQAAYDHGDRQI